MRSYTIEELELMREYLNWTLPNIGGGRTPAERAAEIEDRLRTMIAAGIDPQECAIK